MKRALNLDGMFTPIQAPEIGFKIIKFSGGELHIKLNQNINYETVDTVYITHRIRTMDDLFEILIAKDALDRLGVKNIELVIPYLPYARQDRYEIEGESFTLKVFANIINAASFTKVHIWDAHSIVAPALIDNCINSDNHNYVARDCYDIKRFSGVDILLISPDAGASKKIEKVAKYIKPLDGSNIGGVIQCDKTRDMQTGNLSGFKVHADGLQKRPCLIVDDICDGGGTFMGLAVELKKKNAGDLYLFVTHGIFSKGFDELGKYFTKIYTTNSFSDIDNELVIQYKLG